MNRINVVLFHNKSQKFNTFRRNKVKTSSKMIPCFSSYGYIYSHTHLQVNRKLLRQTKLLHPIYVGCAIATS